MQKPGPPLRQPVTIAQMHPHETMTLQRAAARTARIAPAIQAEGQKSAVSLAADRAGEGVAGNGRAYSFMRALPRSIDRGRREICRPDPAYHLAQILQQSLYSVSAPFLRRV
jgi:hypothetical protein